ncbi:MAG: class I SAM-dependent methyltransferase [Spirochaetales bacterium]|nr:class I SAM-dependent methyltransferase [Spirochaetales bacterium]
MKPDYRNWVPKTMLYALAASAVLTYVISFFLWQWLRPGSMKTASVLFFLAAAVVLTGVFFWMAGMYRAFSYDGTRRLSKDIIEGLAEYVEVPKNGLVLDVGCGSGALTIAVAKRNPTAHVIGVDRWGKEYGSFSKQLCENNAKAEGVANVQFIKGDAAGLDFPDERFDAVTSNYVYHNITGMPRQELLLETLRLVKQGGTFAIHDIFSRGKYGDMQSFMNMLRAEGYEDVQKIDTTDGSFMTKKEATRYCLRHSAILYGKK